MSLNSNFILFVLLKLVLSFSGLINGEQMVPCYFAFGGSYFDTGNNNRLVSFAKADYRPYGIDWDPKPTGRFTNALNIADFLGVLLEIPREILPYGEIPYIQSPNVLDGVIYASASSGIRPETGWHLGQRVSMDEQLLNHEDMINSEIADKFEDNQTLVEQHLSNCLYTVGIGDNDYINNYFLPKLYNTSRRLNPEQFAAELIQTLNRQLTTLAKSYGAKKIAVFKIPPLGCSPHMVANHAINGFPCASQVNDAILIFNNKLNGLVDSLNRDIVTSKFTTIDTYEISLSTFPAFKVTNAPCCPTFKESGLCIPMSIPCSNRSANVWWDGVHQCETAYLKIAQRALKNETKYDAYPYDISQLISL